MTTPAFLEPLEARIAPASLINTTTATYEDVDGSAVTIKLSKPLFTDAAAANAILHFDTGIVAPGAAVPQQLQLIDLHSLATAQGVNISVTAHRDATHGGDGFANVGAINALGRDLGVVSIAGDLGHLLAGDATYTTPAVKSLAVQSIGTFGISTQAAGGDLNSIFTGPVGALAVRGDVAGASLQLTAPTAAGAALSSLGSLTVGGSLLGGAADHTGAVAATGKIVRITVTGDLQGGGGMGSGEISATLAIGNVQVGGSLRGAVGADSGSIQSMVSIGSVLIRHDVRGGAGEDSGVVDGASAIGAVTIFGSVIGDGPDSGSVRAETTGGRITSIYVGGDLQGGSGEGSGYLHADTTLGPVTVFGSVLGGVGKLSGLIYAGAFVNPHTLASVMIGGDLRGGIGVGSGSIGAVFGHVGLPGLLDIGRITIHGDVVGNAENSGSINANSVGVLTIGGSVIGGGASNSGAIVAATKLNSVAIGGSLIGGAGPDSGVLQASVIGSARIGHDLVGGSAEEAGEIATFSGGAASLFIGGSVRGGTAAHAGSVNIATTLGSLTISGSVIGTAAFPVMLEAGGMPGAAPAPGRDPAPVLGRFTLGGSASYLQVLAGFSEFSATATNGDASIGAVFVGHDWIASSISAGVDPGNDGFGNSNDSAAVGNNNSAVASRIASITIKGQLLGTVAGSDSFGFDAQSFGAIRIGTVLYAAPTAGMAVTLGSTGDSFARNVG